MRIFLIPHPENFNVLYTCPRGSEIVKRGLIENGVELVSSYDEADFAILDYVPHDGDKKFYISREIQHCEDKLVCIDWIDEPDRYIYPPELCRAYFKRSYVTSLRESENQLVKRREEINNDRIFPFAYCALPEFDIHSNLSLDSRPIEYASYLRPTCRNRWWVLQVLEQFSKSNQNTYHIGSVNNSSRSIGKNCYYDNEYLQYLANTRIIVTANPTGWEGDSRTWESLISGALVFVDKQFTPYFDKPKNNIHLIEYEIGNISSLIEPLKYYLNNTEQAQKIANSGYKHTITNHMPKNRMKIVLDFLQNLL